jgi:hypothetical protein
VHPEDTQHTRPRKRQVAHPPRYGDLVVLGGERFYLVAWMVAPRSALLVRPVGAPDAATDRLVELDRLMWNRALRQWEAAP